MKEELEDRIICPIKNCVNRGQISDCYVENEKKCPYYMNKEFWERFRKGKIYK